MNYTPLLLREEFSIKKLYSVHYFEYYKDFAFFGEAHDFWELLYVDKGEIDVQAGDNTFHMIQGDMVFHQPNEFHNLWANGVTSPNLVVVSFECRSRAMKYFVKRHMRVGDREKKLLATIVKEAGAAFSTPLEDPYLEQITRRDSAPFGAEQIIKHSVEALLIGLVRALQADERPVGISSSVKARSEKDKVDVILSYLKENVRGKITLSDVSKRTLLSRSYIQKLFHEQMHCSLMSYYKQLKIHEAKAIIREGSYNFTQIAELLHYNSIHHLSKQFKDITGMTLTEYASSVKAI